MKRLLSVLFLLSAFACEKEAPDSPLALDTVVQIELAERSENGLREIVLLSSTSKDYPCINYALLSEEKTDSNPLQVSFLGVQAPEGACFTALGPANAVVRLGALENGIYQLRISVPSFVNEGTIEVSEEEVSLHFPRQEGILIVNPLLER